MTIKNIPKMICVIVLLTLLIPPVVSAQGDVQYLSNQAIGQQSKTFSQEELAQMLAPIALYPDTLLAQILMAAAYPFEVAQAERWLTKNPYVTGNALDEALKVKDWDVSILALCHYPKILTMMSENLHWTARLGDAFTQQKEAVMDAVQELRGKARDAGNLATTQEQKVIVEDRIIRIEPVHPDYIYVPAYDASVVYGAWWYPMFPPMAIVLPGLVVAGSGIVFAPRFHVGFGVFGWSDFDWRERNLIIVNMGQTRRFNRRYHDYKGEGHHPWRFDHDRRNFRDKRNGGIPGFSPGVNPSPGGQRWDRRSGSGAFPAGRPQTPSNRPSAIGPGQSRPTTDSGTVKKGHPAVRDRGRQEGIGRQNPSPSTGQNNVMSPGNSRGSDMKSGRSFDHGSRPYRGGMNPEGRKP